MLDLQVMQLIRRRPCPLLLPSSPLPRSLPSRRPMRIRWNDDHSVEAPLGRRGERKGEEQRASSRAFRALVPCLSNPPRVPPTPLHLLLHDRNRLTVATDLRTRQKPVGQQPFLKRVISEGPSIRWVGRRSLPSALSKLARGERRAASVVASQKRANVEETDEHARETESGRHHSSALHLDQCARANPFKVAEYFGVQWISITVPSLSLHPSLGLEGVWRFELKAGKWGAGFGPRRNTGRN